MKPAAGSVFLLAVALCHAAAAQETITNGMSRAEVIRVVGQPRGVLKVADEETLLFRDGGRVVLRGGKVLYWSLALPSAPAAPHPEARRPDPPADAPAATPVGAPVLSVAATNDGWLTSFPQAVEEAQRQQRRLLLDFTGSDWCTFCIRLDRDVLQTATFREFAAAQFVCVKLDFPRKHPMADELRQQNRELATKYGVRGYPTVLILAPDGTLIGRLTGYDGSGAPAYIARLKDALTDHAKQHPAP
jgi:thiol-disulfide isomerase/thioredoxin